MTPRVFVLSPARCSGRRTEILLNPEARFEMAVRLRSTAGASLGDVFSFLSGLYFRGKLAYSQAFARPAGDPRGVLVITPDRGLATVDQVVTRTVIERFGDVPVDEENETYRRPLERDARALAERLPSTAEVVLLGSIATGKYSRVLLECFGERLLFPSDFVGRGDMSRGGLMLRAVDEGRELSYVPLAGAIRHGRRPAKLPKRI